MSDVDTTVAGKGSVIIILYYNIIILNNHLLVNTYMGLSGSSSKKFKRLLLSQLIVHYFPLDI